MLFELPIMDPTDVSLFPQMFLHRINQRCMANPQRIVLPEALDRRVLIAAAEVTRKGLAHITLIGDPKAVEAQVCPSAGPPVA